MNNLLLLKLLNELALKEVLMCCSAYSHAEDHLKEKTVYGGICT